MKKLIIMIVLLSALAIPEPVYVYADDLSNSVYTIMLDELQQKEREGELTLYDRLLLEELEELEKQEGEEQLYDSFFDEDETKPTKRRFLPSKKKKGLLNDGRIEEAVVRGLAKCLFLGLFFGGIYGIFWLFKKLFGK